jgi:hypothetical protein
MSYYVAKHSKREFIEVAPPVVYERLNKLPDLLNEYAASKAYCIIII